MNQDSSTNLSIKRLDQVQLQRNFMIFLGFVCAVVFAGYTLKSGNPLFMVGFVALPFVLMLISRPALIFILAVVLDATGMQIPGVSYTTMGLLAKLLLLVVFILSLVTGQKSWTGEKLNENKALAWFTAVIFLLMAVRGAGIRALGSVTWGGMMYINLLICILFFIAVSGLKITEKQIYRIAGGSLLLGGIGSLMMHGGWVSSAETSEIMSHRLRWLTPFAYAFLPIALAYKKRNMAFLTPIFVLGGIVLFSLTGDRKLFIVAAMVVVGYGFFKAMSKGRYFFLIASMGIILWAGLFVGARYLPLGIQRSVSVIPGVEVDYRMGKDAKGSADWRIEIWKYCLAQSKNYLVIGRGSAFDVRATSGNLSADDIATFSPWFAFETRSYHSGPLSLLIDYGLPGFISMLFFVGLVFRRLWGYASRLASMDTFASRYALALCVLLMGSFFKFYFIMGAIPELAKTISQVAIVYVISSSILHFSEKNKEGQNPFVPDDTKGATE